MRYLFLAFCFFAANLFHAQLITVLNAKTKDPIAAANIYFYKDGKNVLAASTNDLGQVTYNQDYDYFVVSFVGYKDTKYVSQKNIKSIVLHLEEETTQLDEVVIKTPSKSKIVGHDKKKSSFSWHVGKNEYFAMLFLPTEKEKNADVKSVLVNFKSIPKKTRLVFTFYHTTTTTYRAKSPEKKLPFSVQQIVPDSTRIIGTYEYIVEASQKAKTIEVNLDSLAMNIPKEGIAVTVRAPEFYDDKDLLQEMKVGKHMPEVYFHRTTDKNLCWNETIGTQKTWINANETQIAGQKADKAHYLIPIFYEPSIGLKIMEQREIQEETK